MAEEHRSSVEALPEGAPEVHCEGNDLHRDDGNHQEPKQEKVPEVEDRVGESRVGATESQSGELQGSEKAPTGSNLETLAVESSGLNNRSDDLQGSTATTPNMSVKAESKETIRSPEKENVARKAAQAPPTQTEENVAREAVQAPPTQTEENDAREVVVQAPSTQTEENVAREAVQAPPTQTEENVAREAVQATPKQTDNQLQVSVCPTPLSELSPTSVTQSISSVSSPTLPKQKLTPLKINNAHVPEVDKKNPSGGRTASAISVARTSASDGYNWRKYGQKQVKSPTGSRSYYRCTHSDCCAKKIECCDHLGHVIDIVYKSQHSHDPPRKINSTRESKFASPNEQHTVRNRVPEQSRIKELKNSEPSLSAKEPLQDAPCPVDKRQQNSSDVSDNNGKVVVKEEHIHEPELKKRMKKDDLEDMDSSLKPGKKQKLVVHAAGGVGISGDGYRWRKYGQKMVKGNPHPRNYYRCTSAGCPVRKHIETAVDNSNAVIITYKGVHDHDMPVPKKRHGPPSAPLVAAAAPASMNKNSQPKKPDSPQKQKTPTKWSVDTEGELTGEAMDLGGEKAMESARTLLSIGFEIKPC